MARTQKKAVTAATVEAVEATDATVDIRSVGEAVAEVVAALPAPKAISGAELFIPLDKLKKSPRNARKTPHSEGHIEALAASIAAKGMLQNLVVEPETDDVGEPTGFYLVTVGEGRRLAHLLRVKRKQIGKTEHVRCVLDTANDPQEISLDENVTREAMLGSVSQLSCWVRTAVMVMGENTGAYRRRHMDVRVKRSRSEARTTLEAAATPQARANPMNSESGWGFPFW
jgi:hypothetical protein